MVALWLYVQCAERANQDLISQLMIAIRTEVSNKTIPLYSRMEQYDDNEKYYSASCGNAKNALELIGGIYLIDSFFCFFIS